MKIMIHRTHQKELRHPHAFTLVEILIVVVILGILAAIAVPKFSNASIISRENSMKEDLRLLRTQISVYRTQHNDVNAGYPGGDNAQSPSQAAFLSQMTQYSDSIGNVSATAGDPYKWGPYLQQMPVNPISGLSTMKMLAAGDTFTADGTTGWLYQPSTGQIEPNQTGADSDGNNYTNY